MPKRRREPEELAKERLDQLRLATHGYAQQLWNELSEWPELDQVTWMLERKTVREGGSRLPRYLWNSQVLLESLRRHGAQPNSLNT